MTLTTRTQRRIALAAVVVLAIGGLIWFGPSLAASNSTGQEVCTDAFNEEWTHSGYMKSIPPVVYCEGPNGQTGIVEMPPEMREELGIVVANDSTEADE